MSFTTHPSTAAHPLHLTQLAQVNLKSTPLEHVFTLLRLAEEDEPQATLIGLDGSMSRVAVPEERTYFNGDELEGLLGSPSVEYHSIAGGPLGEHRLIMSSTARLLREDLTPATRPLNLVATALWQAAYAGTGEKDDRRQLLSEFVISGPVLVMLDNEIPY